VLCVRWYLRYSLSYRDLTEIMCERNLSIDPSTIWRWVQRYAPELNERIRRELKPTNVHSERVSKPERSSKVDVSHSPPEGFAGADVVVGTKIEPGGEGGSKFLIPRSSSRLNRRAAAKRRTGMKNERESPRRNAVPTQDKIELSREAETSSRLANGKNSAVTFYSKQTDSEAGTQTKLRSLRDAIWEAINRIEEKAPGTPIHPELVTPDRVADELGSMMRAYQGRLMDDGE
jgi:hypothetical protein